MSATSQPQPYAPKPATSRLQEFLAKDLQSVNAEIMARMQSEVTLIPQMAAHLISAGGKRLRPLLTLAAARLCDYSGKAHIALATAVEFIHTATLLHDDVVDDSQLRRGRDTANAIWGNKSSVLVGDFLFSRSFQLMVQGESLEVLRILSDAAATIAEGEVQQLLTANNLQTTSDQYLDVISAKTAALFAAACEVGAVIANVDRNKIQALRSYGMHLGYAFQISDDVFDYYGLPGKQAGDDFRDGKVTLPLILAFAQSNQGEKEFWQRCIEKQQFNDADFAQAQAILEKYQSLPQSLQQAASHAEQARACLDIFPNSELKQILLDTADYAAKR